MNQKRYGVIISSRVGYTSEEIYGLEVLTHMVSLETFYNFVYKLGNSYNASATLIPHSDESVLVIDITTSQLDEDSVITEVRKMLSGMVVDVDSINKAKRMIQGYGTVLMEDVRESSAFVARKVTETGQGLSLNDWKTKLDIVEVTLLEKLKNDLLNGEWEVASI